MTAPGQPRRTRRAAAVTVVAGLTACGAVVGAVWVLIAPPIHTITALTKSGERVDGFLGKEADNLFVSAAMMIGLLTMLAIVSAVLVWQWRAHRGPVLAAALWGGLIAAGVVATSTGAVLAHWRYGTADHKGVVLFPENRVHYFTEAPPVFLGHNVFQIAVTLLLPAAIGALVYALMTVATPRDDLDAWPPEDPHHPARSPGEGSGVHAVRLGE